MKLIDKDAILAEIERRKQVAFGWLATAPNDAIQAEYELCDDILSFLNTVEVKEVDLENYNKVKRLLSLSFMHFLDKNRPQGKMCLSNMECADIDKAFDEMDWAKLFRYLQKYLEETQKGEEV